MNQANTRLIYDADSHIIETKGWLESYASENVAGNLSPGLISLDTEMLQPFIEIGEKRLAGKLPKLTSELKKDLFGCKHKLNQWAAYGAADNGERSDMLDQVGFASQLVFPTLAPSRFANHDDLDIVYGGCEALTRAMVDFCSKDARLLPVGYMSLRDPQRSARDAQKAIDSGIRAMLIRSDAVDNKAPSHIDYDSLWRVLEASKVPVILHIGSGQNMPGAYFRTGISEQVIDSPANVETTHPKDLPVLHHSPERWLTCMIYDGVFDRFPELRVGMIELGANWVPAMVNNLDYGVSQLGKFDLKLKSLAMKPSEYVLRHVRFTPFHFENAGWILRNVGKELLMFNSDYPHPEGGKDPMGHFTTSLQAIDANEDELDHFFSKNYADLLGISANQSPL